jgi:hypothetical protein
MKKIKDWVRLDALPNNSLNRTRIQRPSHPHPSLLAGYPGVMSQSIEIERGGQKSCRVVAPNLYSLSPP